jgi:hypothetical protein
MENSLLFWMVVWFLGLLGGITGYGLAKKRKPKDVIKPDDKITLLGYWTSDHIHRLDNFQGVCHECGENVDHDGLWVNIVAEDETKKLYWPIYPYQCPKCKQLVRIITVYKNLDVTKEFETVKHENS